MEVEIGSAAGAVWQYLHHQHGDTTLTKLKQGTKLPDQIVLMAIGWLAREGKLEMAHEGRALRIALRGP